MTNNNYSQRAVWESINAVHMCFSPLSWAALGLEAEGQDYVRALLALMSIV